MGDHKKKGQRRIIRVSPQVIQGLRESQLGRGVNRAIVRLRNMLRSGEEIFSLPLRRMVSRKTGENSPEMQAIRDMNSLDNFQFAQDNVRTFRLIGNGAVSPSNGKRILEAVKKTTGANGIGRQVFREIFTQPIEVVDGRITDPEMLIRVERYDDGVRSVSASLGQLAAERSSLYDALQLPLNNDEVNLVNTRLRQIQIEAREQATILNRLVNQLNPPRPIATARPRTNQLPPKGTPGRRLLDEIFHDTSRVAFQSAQKFGRENAQALGIVGAQRSRIAQRMEAAQRIDQSGL